MVVRLRKGPTGPLAEPSSSDAGISTLRWVDPATELPPAEQTGSVTAPFSTIQAALDSLAETSELAAAVILAPGDYNGANAVWTSGEQLTLQGFPGTRNIGTITSAIDGLLVLINLGTNDGPLSLLSITDTSLQIESCFITDISAPGSPTTIRNSTVTAASSLGGLDGFDTTFRGTVLSIAATSALRCAFDDTASLPSLTASDCQFSDTLTIGAGGPVEARDCSFGNVTGGSWSAWNSSFAVATVEDIEAVSCSFFGLLTVTDFAAIASSLPNGGINATGADLSIDTSSFALARSITPVLFGTLLFIDAPIDATLSITVPAVLAGAVGYADTTLVGTTLEGLFAVSAPVTINPQSDLVPAGAGGALTNARISAANTLRSTFVGPLAGGAANFTVCRGR